MYVQVEKIFGLEIIFEAALSNSYKPMSLLRKFPFASFLYLLVFFFTGFVLVLSRIDSFSTDCLFSEISLVSRLQTFLTS